ncbi:hypothetical protein [Gemmatimonas sp.]|uniref:hypothetical protein n=1 Tax=Gemmatimonas sp. TaxID=1962908 RepID=UPI00356B4403
MPTDESLRPLDALNARVMRHPAAARLTLMCRMLLAVAFIPTGSVKLMGERFTSLGVNSSVGAFFEAMYQTGGYWRFLGLSQVLAGALLLIPATAFYGAVMFVPILVNVVVITIAIEFKGTSAVTVAMLLANLWLLAWDWPRWRAVLINAASRSLMHGWSRLERAGWLLGGASVTAFFFAVRSVALKGTVGVLVGLGVLGGVLVVTGWVRGVQVSPRS